VKQTRINISDFWLKGLNFIFTAALLSLTPSIAKAEYVFSSSINQTYEHSSSGQGVKLRGAYVLSPIETVGLSLSGTLIQEDFRKYFAMTVNGSASYRRKILFALPWDFRPFYGGLAGIGFWTACVAKEQCGGFGPSAGVEIGVFKEIPYELRGLINFRFDWQSGLFGPQDPIYIFSLSTGIEY